MLTRHIAIVPEVGMNASELARVSAALQKQVTRDLSPVWGISATVDPFPNLEDLPAGYWPLVLTFRELGIDAGIHVDEKGQPYALVEMSPSWSLTASHICLEMLSDPFGNRMLAGNSPRSDQGQVEFLTDICDPCGHPQYAYVVNDVLVSDFCTPSFWEPASRRERYSFTGAVQAPLEVLPGGHMRWYDPASDTWWTRRILGDGPCDVNIGRADSRKSSPREFVDAHTPHHLSLTRMTADAFEARMGLSQQQALVAARSRAYLLRTTLGTSRPRPARGHELEGGVRVERGGRHPQVLGALLRASRAIEARENAVYEETVLADEVEEVTTVDDMSNRQDVAVATVVVSEPEAPPAHRTVPPPLPQTMPIPAEAPTPAAASPAPVPSTAPGTMSSFPPGATSMPPAVAPVARDGRGANKANFNSTIAIAAIAAAVVLGLALRDRSTPQAGAAPPPRLAEPASQPTVETRPAPAPVVAPAAPIVAAPSATVAPPPPAVTTSVAAVAATPAVATPPPAVEAAAAAARPAAARPKAPAVAAPPVARAPRPTPAQSQDSLDNLIDDRR
jgi:hypothetical protein